MSKSVLFAVLAVLFVSGAAMALPSTVADSNSHTGTTGGGETGGPTVPGDMIPEDDAVGPVGIVNELYEAHSTITDIMIDHSEHDYSMANDIVFTMTFVDEDEEKLHVILDPVLLTLGFDYDESDIAPLLEIGGDRMDVKYGVFVPDGHIFPSPKSQIDLWISLYDSRCDSPTASSLCKALFFNLATQNHYVLDSNNEWQPPGTAPEPEPEPAPAPAPAPATLSTTVFLDDFETDRLDNWTNSGRYSWEAGSFDDNVHPPGYNNTNSVASADRCTSQCVLTTRTPVDLSSENRTALSFYRYVDQTLDSGEYLRAEVTTGNGTWTRLAEWAGGSGDDDGLWHFERFDITPYISDSFQARFVAHMSSSSEDVGIDDVIISRVLEFYGGNNYTMFLSDSSGSYGHTGTITIGATNASTGVKGIMTAGHNILLDSTQTFHNHTVGNDYVILNRNPVGVVNVVDTDVVFIPIEDPNVIISNKVQMLNGTVMNVTYGSLSDVPGRPAVHIYGALNNDDGRIQYKNATIRSNTNALPNMGLAGYDSNKGDSGAPVIHHNASGSNNLIGLHVGGVCAFNPLPEFPTWLINVTSTSWCDKINDSYHYKAFVPWEVVKPMLNMQ